MLYSHKIGHWNNKENKNYFDFTEEQFFSEIPTYELVKPVHAEDKLIQTNNGLYQIEKIDRVLYRENPVDFRSGVWYTVYYTPNGFIFKVED